MQTKTTIKHHFITRAKIERTDNDREESEL
jgi:hypothetical protein